jgi:hypothetical protein
MFLLNRESKSLIRSGTSSIKLVHAVGECFTNSSLSRIDEVQERSEAGIKRSCRCCPERPSSTRGQVPLRTSVPLSSSSTIPAETLTGPNPALIEACLNGLGGRYQPKVANKELQFLSSGRVMDAVTHSHDRPDVAAFFQRPSAWVEPAFG